MDLAQLFEKCRLRNPRASLKKTDKNSREYRNNLMIVLSNFPRAMKKQR